jgi:hypothetical protein
MIWPAEGHPEVAVGKRRVYLGFQFEAIDQASRRQNENAAQRQASDSYREQLTSGDSCDRSPAMRQFDVRGTPIW